jgi:subtilisin family serine protease
MKKTFLIASGIFFFLSAGWSQRLAPEFYWIQLKDKKETEYSLDDPASFLSSRAIERRLKQDIAITELDLPVSESYIDSIRSTGVTIHGSSKWFNSVIVKTADSLALDKIASFSFVEDFRVSYDNFTPLRAESTAKSMSTAYEGAEYYGETSPQMSILAGNFLHNFGYRGNNMLIAVLDAGFFKVDELEAFENMWEENRVVAYRDFVDPASSFFDQSTHGLAVMSTLAAYLPDTFVGTAPKASYLMLRSEEASRENKIEEANWILAAEFADSIGADIITSSLGYYDFPTSDKMNYTHDDLTGDSALITRAAEIAFSRGMVIVSSAGNEGTGEWFKITPPADGPNVLAVGSIDTAKNVTSFSSRGNTADGRIKPDVMAVGFRTRIINALGIPADGYGTSFAAPQVSGLIACLWQAAPEKTNKEIIEAVRRSSSQYMNPDSVMGYGIPNFIHALWELKKDDEVSSDLTGFIAYPNPSSGVFELQTTRPELSIKQIDIFSSGGKLVHSSTRTWKAGETITINSLKTEGPGIYFLIAQSTGGEIVTKLIKL